jgi:hypothetical protein
MAATPWFQKMTVQERIAAAKKTRRVVDHVHYLLKLHENNAIVIYSPTLSAQIDQAERNSDLVEIAKRSAEFSQHYARWWGGFILQFANAASGRRPFLWSGLLAAMASAGVAAWKLWT